MLIGSLLLIFAATVWFATRTRSQSDADDDSSMAKTEVEQIIQRARWRSKGGDPHSALIQLDALESVIENDPSQKSSMKAIDRLRKGIRNQVNAPDQFGFIESALARAEKLPAEKHDEARKIYSGLIALYQSDRRLAPFIDRAREKLREIDEPATAQP